MDRQLFIAASSSSTPLESLKRSFGCAARSARNPFAITVCASRREKPMRRNADSASRSVAKLSRFTVEMVAISFAGNVTTETSNRSISFRTRTRRLASKDAPPLGTRKPMDNASRAPSRMSARISRARSTSSVSCPRTARPLLVSFTSWNTPIGSSVLWKAKSLTRAAGRFASDIWNAPGSIISPTRSTLPKVEAMPVNVPSSPSAFSSVRKSRVSATS